MNKLTIAHGYPSAADTAGTVVGPAGLAYDSNNDILYVASEGDDKIYKLKGAGHATSDLGTMGQVIFDDQTVLHGPLGLIFAPNGNLITANADPTHFPPSDRFADSGEAGGKGDAKQALEQGRAHDADSIARPRSRDCGLL